MLNLQLQFKNVINCNLLQLQITITTLLLAKGQSACTCRAGSKANNCAVEVKSGLVYIPIFVRNALGKQF